MTCAWLAVNCLAPSNPHCRTCAQLTALSLLPPCAGASAACCTCLRFTAANSAVVTFAITITVHAGAVLALGDLRMAGCQLSSLNNCAHLTALSWGPCPYFVFPLPRVL